MKLVDGLEDKEYIIKTIDTDDEEMKSFLFTLGCYEARTYYDHFTFEGWLCGIYKG